ncbi:GTPase-activating protein GYP5 PWA37_000483 [Arxiozyma heterogenica]|uniref:Rab-GAP TBC domain-containing protein n=1 Tax=Arxiozyma heterogenica TaxID=278026 RepID=A0AAN7WLX1_9SACH|nr:hypothetical protein RI543_003931 [Kazachstania heterogenica]
MAKRKSKKSKNNKRTQNSTVVKAAKDPNDLDQTKESNIPLNNTSTNDSTDSLTNNLEEKNTIINEKDELDFNSSPLDNNNESDISKTNENNQLQENDTHISIESNVNLDINNDQTNGPLENSNSMINIKPQDKEPPFELLTQTIDSTNGVPREVSNNIENIEPLKDLSSDKNNDFLDINESKNIENIQTSPKTDQPSEKTQINYYTETKSNKKMSNESAETEMEIPSRSELNFKTSDVQSINSPLIETDDPTIPEDSNKIDENTHNDINPEPSNITSETESQPFITANNTQVETSSTSPPPLPRRNLFHETSDLADMEDISLTNNDYVSRTELSPRLPPRKPSFEEKIPPKNPVPPPLSEELKSPTFRKNMKMFNQEPMPHHKYGQLKQHLVSNISSMPLNSKEPSAADINLIVNRFRVSSFQIDEINPSVREGIEVGQNILKSSFDALMTHGEDLKEGLLNNTIPSDKLSAEEEREFREVTGTNWTFWTRVVNDFATVANKELEQLECEITKGIPRQIRGIIWQLIANSKSQEMEDIYETLLETESPHEAVIRRDINRTNFIPKERCEELFRVLKVYSVYDPDVGYTQGMAFITTPLLLNCNSEAESFGLLVSLMKYYNLREFYLPGMPGLMLMLYQFDRLLEENTPTLANHLVREGIRSSMYATQWFLTIFAYKFPLEFVLKIFDILFFEGIESLLKFAVNLIMKNEKSLMFLKFDQLLNFLKNKLFNVYLDQEHKSLNSSNEEGSEPDFENKPIEIQNISREPSIQACLNSIIDTNYNAHLFVKDAMENIAITPISLHRYRAEYDSLNQIEKRKETEYDSLKIKNFQLQRERKKLKHDYKVLNEEHFAIAKELIKYRLDNETLLDENNDLKDNLKAINEQIEEEINKSQVPNPDSKLPVDLKQDLERTIKRNSEVTALNKLLQSKITELENNIKELKSINKGFAALSPINQLNSDNIDLSKSEQSDNQSSAQPQLTSLPTYSNGTQSSSTPNVGNTFSHGWSGFKKVFKK